MINVEARLLHLHAKLTHHLRRLRLVLICLNLSLDLVRVEVPGLIGLGEGVMVGDSITVVAEATEIGLGALLLLNRHSHDFNLVIGEADLNLELGRHLEFISFN